MDKRFLSRVAKQLILQKEAGTMTQEIADQVDWRALESKVSELLGVPVTLKTELSSGGRLKVRSNEDLADQSGVARHMFSSLFIADFGTGIIDKENTKQVYVKLIFSYTHPGGGSNGSDFMYCWYDLNTKQWIYEVVKQ